jgi:predicted RNase H-like HicB family nuclease
MFPTPTSILVCLHQPPEGRPIYDIPPVITRAPRWQRLRGLAARLPRFRSDTTPLSRYVVIYERAEDGWWRAYLPDLPGLVARGATRSEVSERIAQTLAAYADDLHERGRDLPRPHHAADTVAA